MKKRLRGSNFFWTGPDVKPLRPVGGGGAETAEERRTWRRLCGQPSVPHQGGPPLGRRRRRRRRRKEGYKVY